MAQITTRQTAGTGATVAGVPLTNAQIDQNFINLNTDLSNAVYLSTAQTITGIKTFSNGLITGNTSYPSYSASIDFGSDVGGTWRKIITVSSPNVQYSTIGFKIEVTDPQANHATTSSPDNIITQVYWVACVRTNDTVLDTPDSCYVRGPGSLIRAVKTSTGNYEIQVQCLTQYRELTVDISVYAVNGAHTVTYSAGTTASTGTVQYNAAIGTYTNWFGNISATGTGYVGGLLTANSGIYRATANGVAYWLQQDGTGRNHWYWGTAGGLSPTFSNAGEDASSLTLHVTTSGAGGSFFHRSADGVGKNAGDPITWTTTIYSDLNTFSWKGNTVWHSGNDGVGSGLDADLLDGQSGSYYTTAGNLTGTIPSSVLGASSLYLGTTAVALNRASAAGHTLNGVSIDGNAGTVTNGVYTTGNQTIAGVKTFTDDFIHNSATNTKYFYFSRSGSTVNEFTRVGRDDAVTHFYTKNDETTSAVKFTFENTDTETGGGVGANTTYIQLNGATTPSIDINGQTVLHTGNYSSYALPLTGGTLTNDLNITRSGGSTLAIQNPATDSRLVSTASLKLGGSGGLQVTIASTGLDSTVPINITGTANDTAVINADSGSFNGRHVRFPGRVIAGSASTGYPMITYNAIPTAAGGWNYLATDTVYSVGLGSSNRLSLNYAASGTAGTAITWTEGLALNNSGNVAIGNATPLSRLTVNGGLGVTLTNGSNYANIAGNSARLNYDSTNGIFSIAGDSSSGNTAIALRTSQGSGSVEHVRLTAAGSVGIGTDTPLAKLDVRGTIRNAAGIKTYSVTTTSQGNVNSTYEIMRISRDTVNWSTGISYEITVYNSYYRGGTTKWLIHYNQIDSGTVICTYSGGTTLHRVYLGAETLVSGTINYRPVLVDIPNYMAVSIEVKYSTTEVTTFTGSGQVQFTGTMSAGTGTTYSGDTALVPSGGNLGVGTNSPLVRLQVNNNATVGTAPSAMSAINPIIYADNGSTANGSIVIKTHTPGAGNVAGAVRFVASPDGVNYNWAGIAAIADVNSVVNSLAFYTSTSNSQATAAGASTERMRIDGSGNLGIGTSSPGTKLDVNGDLRHTGLTMSAGTNVDQVYSVTDTLTLTTAWQDTTVNAAELATGTYIVQVLVHDNAVGGGHWYTYYSGVMSWYATDTNEASSDEIMLHRAGHASTTGNLYLRVLRTLTADVADLKLQIAGSTTNTGTSTYQFKFRRLI